MAYELAEGKTNLWKNEKKTSENAPDYTGKIMWNGELLNIAYWINEVREGPNQGKKYMSGNVDKYEKPAVSKVESSAHVKDAESLGGAATQSVIYSDTSSDGDIPF